MMRLFRTTTVPHRHEQSTTWLELFFDLVYVAILVELGNLLSHNLTLQGTIEYALLFIPIWLSWLEPVFYSRRFPTDDIGHRILTVAYMGVMLSLAFELHTVTEGSSINFLLSYAASKIILALMYARAWKTHPEYRDFTAAHVIFFALISVIWIVIALANPQGYYWWALATGLGLLAPFFMPRILRSLGRDELAKPPVKSHYVLDRFGELTIIVLGEFFIKAVLTADEHVGTLLTTFYGVSLLMVSVGVWWLYFDHLEHSSMDGNASRKRIWIDFHYPFLAALAAYGVAGTKVLAMNPGEALADEKRILLSFSLSIILLGTAGFEWAVTERSGEMARKPQIWSRIIGAAFLAVLGIFGGAVSTPILIITIAGILFTLVGFDVYKRTRQRSTVPEPTT